MLAAASVRGSEMSKYIEYRVRPVRRFVVTRYTREDLAMGMVSGGCETVGEFDNELMAQHVVSGLMHTRPEDMLDSQAYFAAQK